MLNYIEILTDYLIKKVQCNQHKKYNEQANKPRHPIIKIAIIFTVAFLIYQSCISEHPVIPQFIIIRVLSFVETTLDAVAAFFLGGLLIVLVVLHIRARVLVVALVC